MRRFLLILLGITWELAFCASVILGSALVTWAVHVLIKLLIK